MEYTIEFDGDTYDHAEFRQMIMEYGGEIVNEE